jgi:hypothetical protein
MKPSQIAKPSSYLGVSQVLVLLTIVFGLPINAAQNKEKTLRQQVIEAGHDIYVGGIGDSFSPDTVGLPELVFRATLIVEGRISLVRPHLIQNETAVATDFQVHVIHVIHSIEGNIPSDITFTLVGGRITFPEGSAETSGGDYPVNVRPIITQKYILFLRPSLLDPMKYEPVAAPRGAFRVNKENRLDPAADTGQAFETHRRFIGMQRDDFVSEVTTLLTRKER